MIARFELKAEERNPFGIRAFVALVSLPDEPSLLDQLNAEKGNALAFSGRMMHCDPYRGAIFLTDASIAQGLAAESDGTTSSSETGRPVS